MYIFVISISLHILCEDITFSLRLEHSKVLSMVPSTTSFVLHINLAKISAFLHFTSKTYIKGESILTHTADHQALPQGSTLLCIWDNGLIPSSVPSALAFALELMCICLFVGIDCVCMCAFL